MDTSPYQCKINSACMNKNPSLPIHKASFLGTVRAKITSFPPFFISLGPSLWGVRKLGGKKDSLKEFNTVLQRWNSQKASFLGYTVAPKVSFKGIKGWIWLPRT